LADEANQAILVQQGQPVLLEVPERLDLKDYQEVLAVVVRLAREEKEAKLVRLDQPEVLAYLE
jgi:hypothetical protein